MRIAIVAALLAIASGCVHYSPKLGYWSVLQNRSLEAEISTQANELKSVKLKYNVDNSPAVAVAKEVVGAYKDGMKYGAAIEAAKLAAGKIRDAAAEAEPEE